MKLEVSWETVLKIGILTEEQKYQWKEEGYLVLKSGISVMLSRTYVPALEESSECLFLTDSISTFRCRAMLRQPFPVSSEVTLRRHTTETDLS